MATAWDRHSVRSLAALQDQLVREQVRDCIAPFSPLWRRRFAELNRAPSSVRSVADVATLPAMGERDVSPAGDAAGMAALVLQAGESGYTLHAPGPELRRALWLRLRRRDAYARAVDADTRATSYLFAGYGFRYLLASTRSDLDVVARAGARLWAVLGLTSEDVLISAVPPNLTAEHVALSYAAMAAGAPAIFPGESSAAVAAAARLAPPTVLAVLAASAPKVLSGLSDLGSVRTLLLVGAPTDAERIAAAHALSNAGGGSKPAILAVHAPSGARLLWGECRQSSGRGGLHTYPDLDLVQVIDPDSGEPAAGGGELVLTQLGMRGSALLRWRTGDVVSAVVSGVCPSCGRTVPRVEGARRAGLITRLDSGRTVDLRSVAGVLAGRPDLEDWRVVVGRRRRDGAMSVVVHVSGPRADSPEVMIGIASDMRTAAGTLPAQLVAADRAALAALSDHASEALSDRILLR